MGMPALTELDTPFLWIERGYYKQSYKAYFQLAIEEAMQKRQFMPVELSEVPAGPWEPEALHEQELAIQRRLLSSAKIIPGK